jgi:hypothetical protein
MKKKQDVKVEASARQTPTAVVATNEEVDLLCGFYKECLGTTRTISGSAWKRISRANFFETIRLGWSAGGSVECHNDVREY